MIFVSVTGFEQVISSRSEEKAREIAKDIKKILQEALRGGGDVILKDWGELAIVLVGCDKVNVLRVEGRLSHALEDYLLRVNLSNALSFHFSSVTYPDDGSTEEELLTRIRRE